MFIYIYVLCASIDKSAGKYCLGNTDTRKYKTRILLPFFCVFLRGNYYINNKSVVIVSLISDGQQFRSH